MQHLEGRFQPRPFFDDPHMLRGDVSVRPSYVGHSLEFVTEVSEHAVSPNPPMEGSKELFTHDLTTINEEDICQTSPSEAGNDLCSHKQCLCFTQAGTNHSVFIWHLFPAMFVRLTCLLWASVANITMRLISICA